MTFSLKHKRAINKKEIVVRELRQLPSVKHFRVDNKSKVV
jgi:hypothetical protein